MELQQGRGIFAPYARVSHNDARDFGRVADCSAFRYSARRERPSRPRSGNRARTGPLNERAFPSTGRRKRAVRR